MEAEESVLDLKIKQMVDNAMQKHIGVSINEIKSDISDAVKKGPLIDFNIDTSVSFKKGKTAFKKHYLIKLLIIHSGNISDASKSAGIERETLQRLVKKFKINAGKFREENPREYIREVEIKEAIKKTLDLYKESINPNKLKEMYVYAPELSKNIAKIIPVNFISLKDAEREFEKIYIECALRENKNNISKTARMIKLRFETLHRKIKELGIKIAHN